MKNFEDFEKLLNALKADFNAEITILKKDLQKAYAKINDLFQAFTSPDSDNITPPSSEVSKPEISDTKLNDQSMDKQA
jgi:hypothetical protein